MSDVVDMDRTSAEAEYARLCKSWKIKASSNKDSGLDETLISAIMDGVVMIKNDKGEGYKVTIVQNLDEALSDELNSIEYKFPRAADMMQMDNFKDNQQFKKAAAMIASMTGIDSRIISKMGGPDFMIGQAVAFSFLGL